MTTPQSIVRVSMADKVHNLGSTVRDLRNTSDRERFWRVFATGAAGQLAYYRALTDVYRERAPQSPMLTELDMLIEDLEAEMTAGEIERAREIEGQLHRAFSSRNGLRGTRGSKGSRRAAWRGSGGACCVK